jgi:Flp pilus assembly protein TadG
MPVFLLLVFGIIVFGSYLAIVHGVQQLAAEAARCSIAGLNDTERASLAAGYVSANAASYPLIAANRLTVVSATSGSNVFVVTVDYDASQSFIYALPTFVPMPQSRIERSAAIPFGGF